ncbi:hypothetical protein [Chitinophaga tropicalis]|uniref:Uncharacterized protein n=1 Tax=Chitinophaga tropicalis TaxID=2683588 RepID=A0A7K1TZZ9_9BACT|nr:hypothetical protein [Chitinophaga tropicalis]MVT07673.1 hypothetical protein [Chitinophaga tropicalis]
MKTGMKIFWTLFTGILSVAFLLQYASHRERTPNGFTRTVLKKNIEPLAIKNLGTRSCYIIGISVDRVYLGDHSQSGRILELSYNVDKVDTSWLSLSDSIRFGWGAATIYKHGDRFYLAEGVTPNIFAFSQADKKGIALSSKQCHFNLIIPLDSMFVFRTYDTIMHRNYLAVARYGQEAISRPTLLKDQQDGVFSTDGMLLFDSLTERLIYVYYYRNQLISFDKNLKNELYGKTIDTITHSKIEIHAVKSEHSIKFSAPPLKVNKRACASNGMLFVYSGLRGDNEKGKLAFNSSPIDIYRVNDFKYLGSFYVPNYDGNGIGDMAVWNDKLVALRGREMSVYNLHLSPLIGR